MRKKGLIPILIISLIIVSAGGYVIGRALAEKTKSPGENPPQNGSALLHTLSPSDIDTDQLFSLVNSWRAEATLSPLIRDLKLDASAAAKCQDMVDKNYWSHFNPQGVGINEWVIAQRIPFIHFGENLAEGDTSASQTVDAWMHSEEHRANILDAKFTDVGYAVCKSDKFIAYNLPALIVVQHLAQE